MKEVVIYSDGACANNQVRNNNRGGWAAILKFGKHEREISGGEKNTTNNRMELTGVIEGLKLLKEQCSVTIYSDSSYVVNAFKNGWIENWKKNGWRTSNKKPVENQDLWQELIGLTEKHACAFVHVKGHAENVYNNRCDELARRECV